MLLTAHTEEAHVIAHRSDSLCSETDGNWQWLNWFGVCRLQGQVFASAALEVARRDSNSVPLSILPTMYSVPFLKF